MKHAWGPADWYVVTGGVIAILGVLWHLLCALQDNWGGMGKGPTYPEADPRDRVPYKPPHKPSQ